MKIGMGVSERIYHLTNERSIISFTELGQFTKFQYTYQNINERLPSYTTCGAGE